MDGVDSVDGVDGVATPRRWSWATWQPQNVCVSRGGEPFKDSSLASCLLNSKAESQGVKDFRFGRWEPHGSRINHPL